MVSPFPEQGPTFAPRVVFAVIVAPHPTRAKTEGAVKASMEPRIVMRSTEVRGVLEELFPLKVGLIGVWFYLRFE